MHKQNAVTWFKAKENDKEILRILRAVGKIV